VAFLAVHRSSGRFHVARSPRFDFDKAEDILVPSDQINFAMVPRRAKVARNYDVSASAQVEVGVFLAAPPCALMRRSLGGRRFGGYTVQKAKGSVNEPTR
jgi:hypothetical protein